MNCASCSDKLMPDTMVTITYSYTTPDTTDNRVRRVEAGAVQKKFCPSCGPGIITTLDKL